MTNGIVPVENRKNVQTIQPCLFTFIREILPFMIIVVGVENINILVHAVVETSMDLPVRERVGRGLGTVGVSITLTLFAELCLLIIGAMTTIPAVQEFCTFAIAAVIMDYLLQMTFFITVISIDIRRLELSDLGRPAAPYSRYPFGSRHSTTKPSLFPGENEMAARLSGINGMPMHEGNDSKHRRKDSTGSFHSDEDSRSHDKPGNKNRKGRIFTSIIVSFTKPNCRPVAFFCCVHFACVANVRNLELHRWWE
jgi:hypothetical protein